MAPVESVVAVRNRSRRDDLAWRRNNTACASRASARTRAVASVSSAYYPSIVTDREAPSLRRAVGFTTASSILVPAVGLVTAPLLARALSPDGRGELAAALAPSTLMLAAATLGLPEALTFVLAKRPQHTRVSLQLASTLIVLVGFGALAVVWAFLPFLSGGDASLARLILIAAIVTVPALPVDILRGAAAGHQMWGTIALERSTLTLWRLMLLVALFISGELTVLTALLINITAPLVSVATYAPFVWRETRNSGRRRPLSREDLDTGKRRLLRTLLAYGIKVWFGSVATMVVARLSQLFMVPLSSTRELGLYTVANTIADVPLIVAFSVQGAVFGVNSRTQDASQVTATSRTTLLLGATGCGAMAALLPLAIGPLFGSEYNDALTPTLLLIMSAVISIPALMASSGLAAWGRPGLRSIGFTLTLIINLATLIVMVPIYGAVGAALSSLISNVFMNTFMLAAARRVMGGRIRDYWLVQRADVQLITQASREVAGKLLRRDRKDA